LYNINQWSNRSVLKEWREDEEEARPREEGGHKQLSNVVLPNFTGNLYNTVVGNKRDKRIKCKRVISKLEGNERGR
jgi:hypothetical protein